jgi:hypothetical protein
MAAIKAFEGADPLSLRQHVPCERIPIHPQ